MNRRSLRCRSPRAPRTHYTEHAAGTTTAAADNVLDPPLGRHGRTLGIVGGGPGFSSTVVYNNHSHRRVTCL